MSAVPGLFAPAWTSRRAALVDASVVVSRRVAGALDDLTMSVNALVATALPVGVAGRLVVRSAFAPVVRAPVRTVAAAGWLVATGPRLAKVARVEIEIAEHSDAACVVEIRPVSPNAWRWGKWRFDRYFDLAHRAADELAARLALASAR